MGECNNEIKKNGKYLEKCFQCGREKTGVKGLLNHIKILAKAGITDCYKKSG